MEVVDVLERPEDVETEETCLMAFGAAVPSAETLSAADDLGRRCWVERLSIGCWDQDWGQVGSLYASSGSSTPRKRQSYDVLTCAIN